MQGPSLLCVGREICKNVFSVSLSDYSIELQCSLSRILFTAIYRKAIIDQDTLEGVLNVCLKQVDHEDSNVCFSGLKIVGVLVTNSMFSIPSCTRAVLCKYVVIEMIYYFFTSTLEKSSTAGLVIIVVKFVTWRTRLLCISSDKKKEPVEKRTGSDKKKSLSKKGPDQILKIAEIFLDLDLAYVRHVLPICFTGSFFSRTF